MELQTFFHKKVAPMMAHLNNRYKEFLHKIITTEHKIMKI